MAELKGPSQNFKILSLQSTFYPIPAALKAAESDILEIEISLTRRNQNHQIQNWLDISTGQPLSYMLTFDCSPASASPPSGSFPFQLM